MHAHRPGPHGHRASQSHGHGAAFESDRVAAVIEVEGELSSGLVAEAVTLCAEQFDDGGAQVRRVIDLGCGPGVGTALLVEAFRSATVLVVDGSRAMLDRAEARAERLGYTSRVEIRKLDLNEDLQPLGRCDLAWAAMAIHHADDEVATLQGIRSLLDPRGLVCLLERADPVFIRFAHDLGRPGIWDRLEAARSAWFESVRASMPGAMNAETYPSMLAAAGLEVIADRTLIGAVEAPHHAATHDFIAGELQRTVNDLASFAAEADLEALSAFVDETPAFPEGRWGRASVRSSRKLLIARSRPYDRP